MTLVTVTVTIPEAGRIFIAGQNKENLNQIFSRYTKGK
jgi:hypothetical protein